MIARSRLTLLGLMLPLMAAPYHVYADDGVPALLQFAEQYHRQEPQKTPTATLQAPTTTIMPKASKMRESAALQQQLAVTRKALREKEAQLGQKETSIQSLQQELTALRVASTLTAPDKSPSLPDLTALSEFAVGVRQAFSLTPNERQVREAMMQQVRLTAERKQQIALLKQRLAELKKKPDAEQRLQDQLATAKALNQKQQHDEQERRDAMTMLEQQKNVSDKTMGALQLQLAQLQDKSKNQAEQAIQQEQTLTTALERQKSESTKVINALQLELTQIQANNAEQAGQVEVLGQRLATAMEEGTKSAQQFGEEKKRADKAEQALVAGNQTQKQLREEVDGLRAQGSLLLDSKVLKKPQQRQSYAAGVALGRDIQTLLAERKSWGITPDKNTLLAGVNDTFNGQYQLSEDVLASSLAESEKTVNAARNKAVKEQQSKGESFVAEFQKKKGTKKSPAGFWYRIDYPGDEAIAEASLVDIVVKETLADGRVVQDMERSGKVLSQPLSAYPPLFREAIGHLKNHGSLTMVVPPELAYGEAGYPPQVPPNATMVYEVRILNAAKG